MKRSIKIAVAAAVALSATSAFATNGDNLIGMGAKTRGMGGVGIGMSHGAESGIANPAMIGTVKGTEVSFGGTVFMPDVETDMGTGGGSIKSDADLSVIPEVAIAQNAGNGFTWGIGMYGVAGMGVDYSKANTYTAAAGGAAAAAAATYVYTQAGVNPGDDASVDAMAQMYAGGAAFGELAKDNFNMKTTLQLMQFALPLAYTTNGFTFGIAPVLQYGSLDINYNILDQTTLEAVTGSTRGLAQDLGLGYSIGLAYTESALTLGAVYKSAINMEYDGVISNAASDFGLSGFSDKLEQPAEFGLGASYKMDEHTFAVDYKKVKWSDANGYKDFGWVDQDVYAFGYQYAMDNWAIRLGYNHADSAIKENSNTTINVFNLLGFPATVEDHYTIGGSYALTKSTSLDLAYIYAEANDESYSTMLGTKITTKHTQDAVSFQLNFAF
jgi:long-chain fatty acid transport protein